MYSQDTLVSYYNVSQFRNNMTHNKWVMWVTKHVVSPDMNQMVQKDSMGVQIIPWYQDRFCGTKEEDSSTIPLDMRSNIASIPRESYL